MKAVKSISPVESATSDKVEASVTVLKSILSQHGFEVIPFSEAPLAPRYFIQFPDGTKSEEYTSMRAVRWALIEDDKLFNHCRDILYAIKEGRWSEAEEQEWLHENIVKEAREIGYVIQEVKE